MAEAPEVTISLSGFKERAIIYGFALLVGGTTVLDLVSPHGRKDPFTGSQGAALKFEFERELGELRQDFKEHRRDYDNHIKWGRRESIETSEAIAEHGAQIKELMSHHTSHHKVN